MFGMAATIAATTALFCFLSLVAVLVFLWKVYKRGGQLSPEASKGGSLSAERKS
jgi:hypothetical protein